MGVPYKGPKLKDLVARIRHEVKFTRFVRDCPVCGSKPSSVEPITDRYGFETALGHCSECDHRWLTETMTTEGAARFYDVYYRDLLRAYHKEPMGPRFFIRKQKLHTKALWQYLKQWLPAKKRLSILDVGGAFGCVSQFIKERLAERGCKADVTLLDRGNEELDYARNLGHKIIPKLVDEEDWHPDQTPYELILIRKTLHHVADLQTALINLSHVHGHLLFADVVNWKAKLAEAVQIEHKHYFSKKSYKRLFGDRREPGWPTLPQFAPLDQTWQQGVHFGGVWD